MAVVGGGGGGGRGGHGVAADVAAIAETRRSRQSLVGEHSPGSKAAFFRKRLTFLEKF